MQSVKAVTNTASGTTGIQNLTGWKITETSGAAGAVVNLRAGGAADSIIYRIAVETSGDDDRSIDSPVDCVKTSGDSTKNVWYVEVVSGAVRWTVEGL